MQAIEFSWIPIVVACVTILVAIYGAALSTYNLADNRKRAKPSLRISISFGKIVGNMQQPSFLTQRNQDKSLPYLVIQLTNDGYRPVTIGIPFFTMPNKNKITTPNPFSDVKEFPHTLEESKGCTVWVEAIQIAEHLKKNGYSGFFKLSASVHDKVDRLYSSKPIGFNIDKCLSNSE